MALSPDYDILGLLAEFPTHMTPIQQYASQRTDGKDANGNTIPSAPDEKNRKSTAKDRAQALQTLVANIITKIGS